MAKLRMFRGLAVAALATAAVLTAGAASSRRPDASKAAAEMAEAASKFWASLSPDLQAKASFEMKDAERLNWHFIPRARKGLPLKEMNESQRKLAHALLSSGLSAAGHERARQIMSLEDVLFEMEGPASRSRRDPQLYFFSIFGKPDAKGTWAWRVEGHHLSLNFTISGGKAVAVTPFFFGANPFHVKSGPLKGLRAIGESEDLGRALVKALDEEKRKLAVITAQAPKDIVMVPGVKKWIEPTGLSAGKLAADQAALLKKLVGFYAHSHRGELAEQELAKIEKAGWDKLTFSWAGEIEPGQPHYYRVQGPTFLLEYDNVQNGANHAHTVWHDPENNFGENILKAHHEQDHNK